MAGQGYEPQNCKTWIEGQFHFTYEVDKGGGGICDSRDSVINATQRQGSAYLDNTYLIMTFGVCPGIMNTGAPEVRYNCLGSWFDQRGNTWAALVDSGEQVKRFRYRCIVRYYSVFVPAFMFALHTVQLRFIRKFFSFLIGFWLLLRTLATTSCRLLSSFEWACRVWRRAMSSPTTTTRHTVWCSSR